MANSSTGAEPESRYTRVKAILEAAAGDSPSDYGGVGRVWPVRHSRCAGAVVPAGHAARQWRPSLELYPVREDPAVELDDRQQRHHSIPGRHDSYQVPLIRTAAPNRASDR